MRQEIFGIGFCAALLVTASVDLVRAQDIPTTHISIIGTSAGSPPWLIEKAYWSDIEDKTKGKLTATIRSMTELGIKGPEVFNMARLGTANIVMSSLSYSSGTIAENDSLDLPGVVSDIDTMHKGVEAYRSTLAEIYEQQMGLKLLGLWPLAAQVVWMREPISGLEGLKDMKLRVSGASKADLIRYLGAVPTTLPFAEVVPALERGVIDGAVTGTAAGNLAHWTDVTTHLYPLVLGWGMEAQVANLNWWNSLDPRVQELIQQHIDDMSVIGWQQAEAGTNNGIWCTVGDDRCDVTATAPKDLNRTNLTLVEVTPEETAKLKSASQESVLARFANRCGEECVKVWNEKLSPVFGITMPNPAQ